MSIYSVTNLVGPTTLSLLHGDGLTACTDEMTTPGNTICFHAARMLMPSLVLAAGVKLFGDHIQRVAPFKAILMVLPLELAIYLACLWLPERRWKRWLSVAMLLAPFGMETLLGEIANLQVEEGYAYSLLALALALLLFGGTKSGWLRRDGWGEGMVLGISVAGLYLSKSSMAIVVAVLVLAYVLMRRSVTARSIAVVLALAAPFGWALHQHHASGRYTLGTSLDGFNLHKGNNANFLARYPPPPNGSLDTYDEQLNAGLHFNDEWSYNDFHQRASVAYMKAHPEETMEGWRRKLSVIFFSIRKSGTATAQGNMLLIEMGTLLIFRLMLWAGILGSVLAVAQQKSVGKEGAVFLLVVAAVALPYVLGFAFTRHFGVLIYPSVFICCRLLAGDGPGRTVEGLH
jgi:hypothetical protein